MIKGALKGQFQIAYISNDFQRGLDILKRQAEINNVFFMEGVEVHDIYGNWAKMSTALAWYDNVMYELITPEDGHVGVYRDYLAPDRFEFKFHHLGMMVKERAEYDRLLEAHPAAGNEIAFNGKFGEKSRYCYARVPELGHHLEYIWLDPTEQGFFDDVPHN